MDELLAKVDVNGAVYYHEDRLGSVMLLTNSSDAAIERYRYAPFGATEVYDGSDNLLTESAYTNRFRYTGREWLPALGLYDYRNRYYSVNLGRGLSPDPIGQEGGVNLYGYVGNNPVSKVDADGRHPLLLIAVVAYGGYKIGQAIGHFLVSQYDALQNDSAAII